MYEIDQQTIRFSSGKRHRFQADIAETLDFEESIVVRLVAGPFALVQNIFGFDYRGNLLWKIPSPKSFEARTPYVGLFRKGGFLEVLNWDGHLLTMQPKQGSILSEDHYSGGTSHGHGRVASRRSWI
jgi:hypothetical protein